MGQPKKAGIANIWYVIVDAIALTITLYLSVYVFNFQDVQLYFEDQTIVKIILIIAGGISFFWLTGAYHKTVYKKSRINELSETFFTSILFLSILLLILRLTTSKYGMGYFTLLLVKVLCVQFFLVYILRFLLINYAKHQLASGKIYFNTLIIGNTPSANKAFTELNKNRYHTGEQLIGFVAKEQEWKNGLYKNLPYLGNIDQLSTLINEYQVEQIIIALEKNEKEQIDAIVQQLIDTNIVIKIVPNAIDILAGSVKTNNILGASLIELQIETLSVFQSNIKRLLDLIISIASCLILSPLLIFVIIKTALVSKGKIIYTQQRMGYKNKLFTIYKFVSMIPDAEKNGPALSNDFDERITPWGKIMRKWRIDELPQLWNIIKGDMSLIGPRPERPYYIDQIVQKAPYYRYLFRVKPGLTSWGMVQFGYASNVEEMIERMQYDLMYIENASLLLDLKIVLYTIRIIVLGKGK